MIPRSGKSHPHTHTRTPHTVIRSYSHTHQTLCVTAGHTASAHFTLPPCVPHLPPTPLCHHVNPTAACCILPCCPRSAYFGSETMCGVSRACPVLPCPADRGHHHDWRDWRYCRGGGGRVHNQVGNQKARRLIHRRSVPQCTVCTVHTGQGRSAHSMHSTHRSGPQYTRSWAACTVATT